MTKYLIKKPEDIFKEYCKYLSEKGFYLDARNKPFKILNTVPGVSITLGVMFAHFGGWVVDNQYGGYEGLDYEIFETKLIKNLARRYY